MPQMLKLENVTDITYRLIIFLFFQLTKQHLNWQSMKMKVRLAAQTLSSSVADALCYLQQFYDRFTNAGPTIEFIRHVSV